jgi:Bacterial tandem repeat domain 1
MITLVDTGPLMTLLDKGWRELREKWVWEAESADGSAHHNLALHWGSEAPYLSPQQMEGTGQWVGFFGQTLAEFDQISLALESKGYYPVDVSGYDTSNGISYAVIYHKTQLVHVQIMALNGRR